MDIERFLVQVLAITSTFNIKIALILYILCTVGEIGFALPYILETIWLFAGFQLARGSLEFTDLILIWLVAQAGRQTGSLVLYYSGVRGIEPVEKLYKRYIEPRLPGKKYIPPAVNRYLSNPSSFSVAAGRLMGLRVPVALTLGAKRKLSRLVIGILLSSIVWDGIYLIIGGTVGAAVIPNPLNMLLYSLGGLTALYVVTLGVRYFLRLYSVKDRPT